MHLFQALTDAAFTWSLENATRPLTSNPNRTQPTLLLKVVATPGAQALEMHFPIHTEQSLEQMVVSLMKKHLPTHPLLRQWLDSRGNVAVQCLLKTDEDFDCIGVPMHTGLRKLADSKQSVITWNALHHLHSDDRVALWTAAAAVVREAFATGKTPKRRALAEALKNRIIEVSRGRRFATVNDDEGAEVKRKPLEDFALLMFNVGCEMTDMDEWMWGWLGYVLEDRTAEAPQEANA